VSKLDALAKRLVSDEQHKKFEDKLKAASTTRMRVGIPLRVIDALSHALLEEFLDWRSPVIDMRMHRGHQVCA
jgi:hypothetical protein